MEVEKHVALMRVIWWSSGCSAQFQSRSVLKLHPAHRIDLLIDWHYKSPPRQMADGRYWWYLQKYIPPSEVISSIQTFCNAANQFVPSIATLFCKMKLSFANPKTSKRQLLYQRLRKSTSFVDLCYLIVSQKLILFSFECQRTLLYSKIFK